MALSWSGVRHSWIRSLKSRMKAWVDWGHRGPQANTATIFNGTQCDSKAPMFIGNLRGIPPYPSPSMFQFDFAEGTLMRLFTPT